MGGYDTRPLKNGRSYVCALLATRFESLARTVSPAPPYLNVDGSCNRRISTANPSTKCLIRLLRFLLATRSESFVVDHPGKGKSNPPALQNENFKLSEEPEPNAPSQLPLSGGDDAQFVRQGTPLACSAVVWPQAGASTNTLRPGRRERRAFSPTYVQYSVQRNAALAWTVHVAGGSR